MKDIMMNLNMFLPVVAIELRLSLAAFFTAFSIMIEWEGKERESEDVERLDEMSVCREEQADIGTHGRAKKEDRTFAQILI